MQAATPLADCTDTFGKPRKENDTSHGNQSGDPAKAAAAIIEVVESNDPPYMLVLGSDAADTFRSALDALRADLECLGRG